MLIGSTGSTATPFGFAGGHGYQRDPDSGLMRLGERYYDPSIGRFMTRDPIREEGGWNLYQYCAGSPLIAVDPSGEAFFIVLAVIVVAGMIIAHRAMPGLRPAHVDGSAYFPPGIVGFQAGSGGLRYSYGWYFGTPGSSFSYVPGPVADPGPDSRVNVSFPGFRSRWKYVGVSPGGVFPGGGPGVGFGYPGGGYYNVTIGGR